MSLRVAVGPADPALAPAEAVAVGVWAGGEPVHGLAPRAGTVQSTRAEGRWWVAAGLGARDGWGPERAREVAARVAVRADELGVRSLAWVPPTGAGVAGALVEGTLLRAWRRREPGALAELVVCGAAEQEVDRAAIAAEAQNATRRLTDAPPNEVTPSALAARARELPGLAVDVLEPGAEGCGAFAAVAQGSEEPPALIAARWDGGGAGPQLGWIGKAVTFDSGGYSLKQPAAMRDMKRDMGGGAAVLEAAGAVAALGLPVRVLAVVGATENLVSGRALKPGDVVRGRDGTSVEVTNTDAEGRLVLGDCLHWAREHGAERLVDVATLTGGVITALGNTYAGLLGNDPAWLDEVRAAGEDVGEPCWPLPLHEDFRRALRGRVSDVLNAPTHRKGQPSTAAAYLERFAGDVPWAHLDMAGVVDDSPRPYTPDGATGWGARLLVRLAERLASAPISRR